MMVRSPFFVTNLQRGTAISPKIGIFSPNRNMMSESAKSSYPPPILLLTFKDIRSSAKALPKRIDIHSSAKASPKRVDIRSWAKALPKRVDKRSSAKASPKRVDIRSSAKASPKRVDIRSSATPRLSA